MPNNAKEPRKKVNDSEREAATPQAEIEPGETAKPTNEVAAKDAFGAPRRDADWSREAVVTARTKPSYGDNEDKVRKEAAKKLKE